MADQRRRYIPFQVELGYPFHERIFYECTRCGDVVPSRPDDSTGCRCGNIFIDVDYGRLSVEDHAAFQMFEDATQT